MALSINTAGAAGLAAYQGLSARIAEQDAAVADASTTAGAVTASSGDTVQFAHANRGAAASSVGIDSADMAAQLTHLAAAQVAGNVMAALTAQANSSPDAVLALLQ